jgi:hypothetical protein
MKGIAKSSERVAGRVTAESNERVRDRTARRLARLAAEGPAAVKRRLEILDSEWDIERALELQSSAVTLASMILGAAKREKRWFFLGGLVQGFMLQHAVQGWCPPVQAYRWLGFRTEREIEAERAALLELEF